MVPEEKMDEINTYFTRKQSSRQITDCWVATMEKDDVKEGQKGKVTFNFTIGTDGKVGNIKASSLTPPNAKTFESCIAEKMKSWTVTTLEQPFDTSWTFSAGEL
jgi:hypothetical protein